MRVEGVASCHPDVPLFRIWAFDKPGSEVGGCRFVVGREKNRTWGLVDRRPEEQKKLVVR